MKRPILFFLAMPAMAFILSGCIINTTTSGTPDGGVFRSADSGETWEQRVFIGQNKNTTVTIAREDTALILFDPSTPTTLYFVSKQNGVYKTENETEVWEKTTLNSGSYTSLEIDQKNKILAYAAKGNTILKTSDNMQTWHVVYVEARPNEPITSLAIDTFDSSIVYASTPSSVIMSHDFGNTWKALPWKGSGAQKLLISEKNNRTIYLLTQQKGIDKSTNGGETWATTTAALGQFAGALSIHFIDFHPATEHIYLATDYGIVGTTDGGQSWQPIQTIVPFHTLPIQAAIVNPQNPKQIFFTINNVLYKSVDGGTTWKTLRSMQTNRKINFLLMNPDDPSILYAGTQFVKK